MESPGETALSICSGEGKMEKDGNSRSLRKLGGPGPSFYACQPLGGRALIGSVSHFPSILTNKAMQYIKYLIYFFAPILLQPAAFAAGVPFPALQFLVGNWQVEAKPGEGAAHFEFVLDLQGKVLVRHNHVESSATAGGAIHDDLLVIAQEGIPATIKASYFDSDGYLGRYAVTANGNQAVFVSDAVPKIPRYRLTYTALPDGRLNAKLEVAPAGKPNAFANYLEWVATKAP